MTKVVAESFDSNQDLEDNEDYVLLDDNDMKIPVNDKSVVRLHKKHNFSDEVINIHKTTYRINLLNSNNIIFELKSVDLLKRLKESRRTKLLYIL